MIPPWRPARPQHEAGEPAAAGQELRAEAAPEARRRPVPSRGLRPRRPSPSPLPTPPRPAAGLPGPRVTGRRAPQGGRHLAAPPLAPSPAAGRRSLVAGEGGRPSPSPRQRPPPSSPTRPRRPAAAGSWRRTGAGGPSARWRPGAVFVGAVPPARLGTRQRRWQGLCHAAGWEPSPGRAGAAARCLSEKEKAPLGRGGRHGRCRPARRARGGRAAAGAGARVRRGGWAASFSRATASLGRGSSGLCVCLKKKVQKGQL